MRDAIELIKAVVPLAWPLILAILLWKLFPTVKSIVTSRSFSVKIAGMEVSVQDATEQLGSHIEDLQKQVIALREAQGRPAETAKVPRPALAVDTTEAPPAAPAVNRIRRHILWVDDKPSNNAFEISQLQDWNIDVVQARSTDDALAVLKNNARIDAVVSDMDRREDGSYRSQAGLALLNAMRQSGVQTPFIIYSSARAAERNHEQVRLADGDGATSSPIELLEWLREIMRSSGTD